jgi:hypothetical protein
MKHRCHPSVRNKNKPTNQRATNERPTDEDTTSTSTPTAAQASPDAQAPSLEAQAPHQDVPLRQAPPVGPITRARVRELNYIMLLKNEDPGCIEDGPTGQPRKGSSG